MTLTDKDNNNQDIYSSDKQPTTTNIKQKKIMPEKLKMPIMNTNSEMGPTLKEVICQALEQNRATFGLYQAGLLLETCPEEVMFCVLPEIDNSDVTLRIHSTLIESFCWENNIRLIKVDSVEKLKCFVTKVVETSEGGSTIEDKRMLDQTDFNCLLIEYPTEECSEADENLIEFYKLTCDVTPQPIIELPV